jgi:hypothetical protein
LDDRGYDRFLHVSRTYPDLRGLCARCYTHASQLVRDGLTSWETLEAAGKAKPKAKPGPSDLPHRQAWFLGEWAPDWKAMAGQKAAAISPKRTRKPRPKRSRKAAKQTV